MAYTIPSMVDRLSRRNLAELQTMTAWCDRHGLTYQTPDGRTARKLLVGEWGAPRGDNENAPYPDADEPAWRLLRQFYLAQLARLGVAGTFWADGPVGYEMEAHVGEANGPYRTLPTAYDLRDLTMRHSWMSNGICRMDSEWNMASWVPQPMIDLYATKNISLIRMAVLWPQLAGNSGGTLTQAAITALTGAANRISATNAANGAPMQLIIDLHMYGRRVGGSTTTMPEADFSDTWWNIANLPAIKNNPDIHLGLMNEPAGGPISRADWEGFSSRLVTRLRNGGITNRIFMSPWQFWPSSINNVAAPWWNDPLGNTWLELHHYFDYDEGGNYGTWTGHVGGRDRYAYYRDTYGTGADMSTAGLILPQTELAYQAYGPYTGGGDPVVVVTPPTAPVSVTLGAARLGTNRYEFDVTWTAPTTADPAVTGYYVEQVSSSTWKSDLLPATPRSFTLTGFNLGESVSVRVSAYNGAEGPARVAATVVTVPDSGGGDGGGGTTTARALDDFNVLPGGAQNPSTTPALDDFNVVRIPLVPATPTDLVVTPYNGAASLSWTQPEGPAVTGYELTATAAGGRSRRYLVGSVQSVKLAQLTSEVEWQITLIAIGTEARSAPASITTFPTAQLGDPGLGLTQPQPSAPDAPVLTEGTPGPGSALLEWTAPAYSGGSPVTGYTVEGLHPGGVVSVQVPASQLSTVVRNLTNGSAYSFSITATNATGTSVGSNVLSVTPAADAALLIPEPVTDLVGTPLNGGAELTWTQGELGAGTFVAYVFRATQGTTTLNYLTGVQAQTVDLAGLGNASAWTITVQVRTTLADSDPVTVSVTPSTLAEMPGDLALRPIVQQDPDDGGVDPVVVIPRTKVAQPMIEAFPATRNFRPQNFGKTIGEVPAGE